MKRSILLAFGFFVARWLFGRKPLAVPRSLLLRVRTDDPVARLRRAGAL